MATAAEALLKGETWNLIRRLIAENAADKWMSYALAFALLLVVSGATGLSAYMMEDVINGVFISRDKAAIWAIAGAVAGVFIVKGAATYWNAIILARVGNAIVARLQRRMYDTVLAQDLAYFERQQLGDTLVRFQVGAASARDAVNTLILSIGRDVFSLVSLISVMVIQDPLMSLLVLVIGPPAVIGVGVLMRKVKDVARSEFISLGRLMTLVKESFLGVKVVKAFRLEGRMRSDMDDAVAAVERLNNGMARIASLTVPLMETLGGLAVAIAIVYGGWRVIDGGSDPGSFFSFITALLLAYEPARRIARFNVQFQQSMIGVTMVYDLLDQPPARTESDAGEKLVLTEGAVALDGVSFSYDGATPTLTDVSLDAPAGKVTALVGPSGGGKSTIFALIARMRAPTAGRVLVDGRDIEALAVGSLRGSISLVSQDSFLFEGTIGENIRMGRLDATDAEVEAAADAAHAIDFIRAAPGGFDAQVGEGGGLLSGGQRQRIAIARAMLADAPVLLLDEATSALDSASEAKVQEAMSRLMEGRTTLVIAHRLSTIRHAARIHVIDKGRVVESGTHDELLEKKGLYAHLTAVQFGAEAAGVG